MAHEIQNIGREDSLGLLKTSAWHGLGTIIQDDLSAVAACERFGMTRAVEGWALEAIGPNGERVAVETHRANVHTLGVDGQPLDLPYLLGVVGADYQVCQNRELAEFTDALAQTGRVTIESCGSIRGGKRVWFLAKGDAFNIGGTPDEMRPYVLVSNGHDGTQAIRVTPTTVRVVCSNTLHMVIPGDEFSARPETAAITIRHSGKISDKLEQARKAMEYYGATLHRNRDLYDAMQAKRVDQQQALAMFAGVYASYWETADNKDLQSTSDAVRKLAERRIKRMNSAAEDFMTRWTDEQSRLGIGQTVWSAFNAATGYIQHSKTARGADDAARVESRIDSNLFGLNAVRTHEVLAASLAMAS